MDERQFLTKLGIDKIGVFDKQSNYVIDLEDSNDIGRYYSKLSASNDVYEDESRSKISYTSSSIIFIGEKFTITLISDFDSDDYKLICTRR